jgi:hypothetical protein
VIVLYVGQDEATLELLTSVLGEPMTPTRKAAIYAAVAHQLYVVDHTFNEPPNFPIVYLVRTTDDTVGDPDLSRSEPQALPEPTQRAMVIALGDLPADFVWVDTDDEVPRADDGAVEGGGGHHHSGQHLLSRRWIGVGFGKLVRRSSRGYRKDLHRGASGWRLASGRRYRGAMDKLNKRIV